MENNKDQEYMLAALIEIYRGMPVYLPEFDPAMERDVLRDVFSAAISFAGNDQSRMELSGEINKCFREGATIKEQVDLARVQSPDVLNAKMVAAAHLLKILGNEKVKVILS
ncbi:MAG: hypothetical protein ACOY31_06420 [Bacillota bacterium]